MYDIFKTVLLLSLMGFVVIFILLLLKPFTAKKLPAAWQYFVWLAVAFAMIFPAHRLIPKTEAKKIPVVANFEISSEENPEDIKIPAHEKINAYSDMTFSDEVIFQKNVEKDAKKDFIKILSPIWFFGVCIYLLFLLFDYFLFTYKSLKNSESLSDTAILCNIKNKLNIKRKVKIRRLKKLGSPMLTGVFFPTIYLPDSDFSDKQLTMILLHELMHLKRNDLAVKWFVQFVNAVHWFNPMCYLLSANLAEACEISCDMKATEKMDDDLQKIYMKTILELAEKEV